MKQKEPLGKMAWVVVRVERGFVEDARIFATEASARRLEQLWRKTLNPDYDEVGIVAARVPRTRTSR